MLGTLAECKGEVVELGGPTGEAGEAGWAFCWRVVVRGAGVGVGLVGASEEMVVVWERGDTGEVLPEEGRGRAFSFCAALPSRT